MNRFVAAGLLALLTVAGLPVLCQAQPSPPPVPGGGAGGVNRPAFSPYLNLLRQGNGNNSPALNYYGLVRPDLNSLQAFSNVQSAVSMNQRSISDLYSGGGLVQTGVPAQFLNYRGYFLNQGMMGAGGSFGSSASYGLPSSPGIGSTAGSGIPSGRSSGGNTVNSGRR